MQCCAVPGESPVCLYLLSVLTQGVFSPMFGPLLRRGAAEGGPLSRSLTGPAPWRGLDCPDTEVLRYSQLITDTGSQLGNLTPLFFWLQTPGRGVMHVPSIRRFLTVIELVMMVRLDMK